ncbi:MAG TPA: hypothetical protein VGC11_17075 [Acidimicrobiia bacterium]|jgi:hypothetical protein
MSLICLVVTALAVINPRWIESVLPIEPDAGGGELEWALAALSFAIAVALAVRARIDWRALKAATSSS